MSASPGAVGAAVAATAGVVTAAVAVALALLSGVGWQDLVDSYLVTNLAIGLGFLASGCVIHWHRPANAVGAWLIVCGFGHLASAIGAPLTALAIVEGWPQTVARVAVTLLIGGWHLGLGGAATIALLLFPDGRLPTPRWRVPFWWLVVWVAVPTVLDVTNATPTTGPYALVPILAIAPWPEPLLAVAGSIGSASIAIPIAALIVRYVRGDEATRRQLLWLILAVIAMLLINAQRWVTGDGPILLLLSFLLVPAAIAIAIVRYGLLDIRLVLSRTLVYGTLIGLIVAIYAGLVAGVSSLVPPEAGRTVAIGAALVVAFAFAPLRLLLQRLAARAFYGTRSDPAGTAERIAGELRGERGDIALVLEQILQALRLPRIELLVDGVVRAEAGEPAVHATTTELELPGDARLRVSLRAGERRLHPDDRRTLALVATPLGLLVRSLALTEQLRAARAATVEARERERAVLHRDLHDGLGPTLTSAAFRADAADNLLTTDAARARALLDQARADVRSALAEVRRVVYGLRPLELEERGLWGALRHRAGQAGRLAIELHEPDAPPQLSPAAELAAYRIVNEALTNAERHSTGSRVQVDLRADETLEILITDDGDAATGWAEGVGIRSIRDRAEELGGTATLGPAGEGWRVAVSLPL